ncbi:MAG: histone deacetylase, partial [Firmicutes bacterium]|nr:histone deacetylase [Bacillota bacterium]
LLAPDIVVLEGGYSIEGALPYVNAGIIMALAGLDYSGVIEPGLEKGASKNRPVREEVARSVAYLQSVWSRRKEQDLDAIFGEKDYFFRQRYIYYDTDNITEYQAETIKKCPACSGFRRVYSRAEYPSGRVRARTRVKIGAVLLPWHACSSCRRTAEEAYQQMKAEEDLDHVYFQDPDADG